MKARAAFTVIELSIAMTMLLIAVGGIMVLYTTGQRLLHSGLENVQIQRHAQILSERIIRIIRMGEEAEVLDNGDTLDIMVPLEGSESTMLSKIWLDNGSLYYDDDINDETSAIVLVNGVYKPGGNNLFKSSETGLLVQIAFGINSGYLYGNIRPVELDFNVRLRNQEY